MKTLQYLRNVSTLKLDTELCTGCGVCVLVCPNEVFEMNHHKARINDINDCMACGACELNCRFGALSVKSGVGCAAGVLNGLLNNTEPSCDCGGNQKNTAACC